MDKLTKRLRANLLENPAVQLVESAIWTLPLFPIEVTYQRVRRDQMDILMKIMLLAFEETDIRRAANLSEILLVEELFIADLMKKMKRTGLIRLDNTIYRLTTKGKEQLISGIIEEEMEEEEIDLYYSPSHNEYWLETIGAMPKVDQKTKVFRYENHQDDLHTDRIFEVLSESKNGLDENGFQTVVSSVLSFEKQTIEHVPYLEFLLYNKEQDMVYVRVWNTYLERWDDRLEKLIEEQERLTWREKGKVQVEFNE